jgi:hypothetical protein
MFTDLKRETESYPAPERVRRSAAGCRPFGAGAMIGSGWLLRSMYGERLA